jgi:hypothetical protein
LHRAIVTLWWPICAKMARSETAVTTRPGGQLLLGVDEVRKFEVGTLQGDQPEHRHGVLGRLDS